jgi:pyruvate/2-oxoglutarate/acetoin dehydrogenase E1 component
LVHSGIDINTNALNFQWLYRLAVEEVPEHDYMLPLSEAEVSYS